MIQKSFELLNSFSDSIAILDFTGKIIFTNNSWKQFSIDNSGEQCKTDVGINYLDVCKNTDGNESSHATEAVIGISKIISGELRVFEFEYPCHSLNERRWFILRATQLEGSSNLILISHINISKRKIAEELVEKRNIQLDAINSKLNSTMFKIVHDIQGPLNSVEGLINLSKTEKNDQDTNLYFSLIEKSVINLKDFIQETLKLSTLEEKIESVVFKTILNEFYDSIKYSEILSKVELKFNIDQTDDFFTNKIEIVSIVSNLVNNSLKYYDTNKEQPYVLVSVDANETQVKIAVKDNGIGISNDFLSKIFEFNYQIHKGKNSGAGVGLSLVKKSVAILNGQLKVSSTEGIGTEISIVIPNMKKWEPLLC